ncbi:hypothetical protein Tco_0565562 [Tanacetum coccineum]
MAKSQEEVYFSNTSKTATVSNSISIPNEEFSDDTTPSVARKFLNEVKSTIVTLQRVVKHRMTLDTHNWSSIAHQETHKILKEENFPIVNQVDARLQNFEIQFLKEAAKFVRDFKSLAKEADESLAKHKALELEIERLFRAVVSQDIMSIVQNPSVVDLSNLQTELDRTKERFENYIIKKENEYAKLWNDWYKKCEECKYDKILYDKAYNDMQQKIERLQAQLGDQKGKSKDTLCLRAQLFDKVSDQKDTNKGTSANTKFAKQSILGKPPSSSRPKPYAVPTLPNSMAFPKVGETNALSNPVTSNSVPSSRESIVVNNERVIAPGIFRINPVKANRVDNFVPDNHVNKYKKNQSANVQVCNQRNIKAQHVDLSLENCIIKKENEYAKLWNDWYKKCEECKYDKISYDKAYNDMQQKIERLQAQLGDQKGNSQDTPCVSNTLDPLSQKLENENVELEFQVRNYEKEIAHLKSTYKNLFDSISVTRAQTKTIIDSLQHKLHDTIYENAKLRAQLFDKVSDQKDTNKGMSANTKFAKQSILGKPPSSSRPKPYAVPTLPNSTAFPKVGETNALSNPVTSNSVPSSRESTVVNNERVIAPGIFRINPVKANRVANFVPNKHVKTSVRTKPIIVSQPHDDCVRQYVNGMKSRKKNQSANVSKSANQKKHKAQVWKPKNIGSKERFASPKPSKPRSCLRWSPTGRFFDLQGKIIASSKSESQSDCSKGDNACTSNPQEPINKRFPSSTFSMSGCQKWFDTLLIPLLSEYNLEDKEDHGDNECDT